MKHSLKHSLTLGSSSSVWFNHIILYHTNFYLHTHVCISVSLHYFDFTIISTDTMSAASRSPAEATGTKGPAGCIHYVLQPGCHLRK